MHKFAPTLLVAVIVSCASIAGAADKYPPGPGGTCPDTLKIFNIQNPAAMCHPATLDTVLGVGGIITGFDAVASAYGFYIQNRGFSNWAGIDIFTGATNYNAPPFSLQLGDSVVVYGTTQEFEGESEIEGPDVIQSTNDIIVRKVSSANPLPAPINGTTTTFDRLPTNPNAEQYEGMLVKVVAPMVVRRVYVAGGDLPFNNYLLVNKTGVVTDTIQVDPTTLAGLPMPSEGTEVSSVQGIYNQRGAGLSASYRIQLRDGNDIVTLVPPSLVDVFPIEDNTLRVVFDRNVTQASCEDVGNYSLSSLGSVLTATQTSGTTAELTIDNGLTDGDIEGLTVANIVGAANMTAMTTPQSLTFVNGVVEPKDIQQPDPAFLSASPCEDRSRFAGTGTSPGIRVSFRGIATAVYGSLYYLQGESGGPRNGISVFGPVAPLTPGNKYLVVGRTQEFGTGAANGRETEVVSTVLVQNEGAMAIPAPVIQTAAVLSDTTCDNSESVLTGEDFEGMLVKMVKVRIIEQRNGIQSFLVSGPFGVYSDTILVSNNSSSYNMHPDRNYLIDVTGTLSSNSGSSRRFRIQPRSNADIEANYGTAGVPTAPQALTFAVAPNPARTARITFGLPRAGDVELAVYDLAGRKVAVLERGRLEPGSYSREWSGLDSRGKQVGAGMYFYKLRVEGEVRTIRGIYLR